MKKKERTFWICSVCVLLAFYTITVFVNNATAANFNIQAFPYMNKFISVFNAIKSDYVDADKIDDKDLINGAIKGMLEAIGDPYTTYLSEKDVKDLQTTTTGTFAGVGMIITEKDGFISVVSPIEGTPAYRKGMKSGDLLISVNGESLKGVSVSDAADKLKGAPGTSANIEFLRDDVKYEVELVRAIIDLPTVKHDVINNEIGYLRITQFSGTTDKHVKEALLDFKSKNVKGIIMDLRMNPGGLLSSAISIVDFFQDKGTIVSTKGRRLKEQTVNSATSFNTIVAKDIPIIVLIDNGSASASEIVSGALKDTKRGILVGDKSFGKGSVQSIQFLPDGTDGFKMTTAKYYTPSGVSIHGIGIEPDITIKEPELSEEEREGLKKIYKDKVIDNFVKEHHNPTNQEIDSFLADLKAKGYVFTNTMMRRLLKNTLDYENNSSAPIYDLEYDIQLKKAMEILTNGSIKYHKGEYSIK